jgi:hypothetical protein
MLGRLTPEIGAAYIMNRCYPDLERLLPLPRHLHTIYH